MLNIRHQILAFRYKPMGGKADDNDDFCNGENVSHVEKCPNENWKMYGHIPQFSILSRFHGMKDIIWR